MLKAHSFACRLRLVCIIVLGSHCRCLKQMILVRRWTKLRPVSPDALSNTCFTHQVIGLTLILTWFLSTVSPSTSALLALVPDKCASMTRLHSVPRAEGLAPSGTAAALLRSLQPLFRRRLDLAARRRQPSSPHCAPASALTEHPPPHPRHSRPNPAAGPFLAFGTSSRLGALRPTSGWRAAPSTPPFHPRVAPGPSHTP